MIFTKNLTETEEILFLRIFRFLKYKIAVGKIKTIDDANAFVLSTYFDKIYDLGNWERWEHCEHVREIFTEKNIKRAFSEVEYMDPAEKETFIFEMEN